MHIETLLRHIQAYSAPCVTLAYSLAIFFPVLTYLEPEPYSKPCKTLTRYIQNSVIVRTVYSGMIRTLCNAYICRNLIYFQFWNIPNPSITSSSGIFKSLSYLRKQVRDDTHITFMKIVQLTQFSRPPTTFVQLRPKFFHPLNLGRPISSEPPRLPPPSL